MNNKFLDFKNNAFTLAESLLALVLLGTLITLTTSKFLRQAPDINKTRFKKAYVVTEQTIQKLVRNEVLYPDSSMFRNTEPVTTTVGDQFGVSNRNAKFRDAFKYYLSIIRENIQCDVYKNENSNNCFMSNDGIVYGIPDTDFSNVGIVDVNSTVVGPTGINREITESYVPITVYTSWKNKRNVSTDAFVIGVRYDGRIKILNNTGCARPDDLRCKAEEYLESEDIKANSN